MRLEGGEQVSTTMNTYICWDSDTPGDELEIIAKDEQTAAEFFVQGCEYHAPEHTWWAHIYVRLGDRDAAEGDAADYPVRCRVPIHPEAPQCTADDHKWSTDKRLLRDDFEGVRGHQGGVTCFSVCVHCGCAMHEDTWAQDMADGEQGLYSIHYDPDDDTLDNYLASLAEDDLEDVRSIVRIGQDPLTGKWAVARGGTPARAYELEWCDSEDDALQEV